MVLVDTSVWIDHLRNGNPGLASLLDEGEVICHPFVIGELACGRIRNRRQVLAFLEALSQGAVVSQQEALALIDSHHLMGMGLGFIDIHMLASARLSGCTLWTRDMSLHKAAADLGVLHPD
jgi:predicted nucleic acid-binding protein